MKIPIRYLFLLLFLLVTNLSLGQDNFLKTFKPDASDAWEPASIIASDDAYFFSDINNNLYKIDKQGNFIWFTENITSGSEDFEGYASLSLQNHQLSYDKSADQVIMVGSFVDTEEQNPGANDDFPAYRRIESASGEILVSEYVYAQGGLNINASTSPQQTLTCVDIDKNGEIFAAGKSGAVVGGTPDDDWSYVGGKLENFSDIWGYQKSGLGNSQNSFWVDIEYYDDPNYAGVIAVGNAFNNTIHICKYASNGTFQWDREVSVTNAGLKVNAMKIVQGDVVFAGEYDDGQNAIGFAARYNTSTNSVDWFRTYDVPELIEIEINRFGQLAVLFNDQSSSGLMLLSAFSGIIQDSRDFNTDLYVDFTVDAAGAYLMLGFDDHGTGTTTDDEIIVRKLESDLSSCTIQGDISTTSQSVSATSQSILENVLYNMKEIGTFDRDYSNESVSDNLICCSKNLNIFPHDIVWYCVTSGSSTITIDLADYGLSEFAVGSTINFYWENGSLIQSGSVGSVDVNVFANTCSGIYLEIIDPNEPCVLTDFLAFCVTDGTIPGAPSKTDVFCLGSVFVELPGASQGQNFSVTYFDGGIAIPNNTIDPASYGLGVHQITKEITNTITNCTSLEVYQFEIVSCTCSYSVEWEIADNALACEFYTTSSSSYPAGFGIKRYRYSIRGINPNTPWTVIADVDNQSPFVFTYNYGSPYFGGFDPGMYELKLEVWFYNTSSANAEVCGYYTETKSHEIQPCDFLKKDVINNINSIKESQLSEVNVLPNPSDGVFQVNELPAGASYEVIDMLGRTIIPQTVANTSSQQIDLSGNEVGVYTIRILHNNSVRSMMVVKK